MQNKMKYWYFKKGIHRHAHMVSSFDNYVISSTNVYKFDFDPFQVIKFVSYV